MSNEHITKGNFFDCLVTVVPEFKPVFDDQLQYFEELLPVLMCAELGRFFLVHFQRWISDPLGGYDPDDLCSRVTSYLENGLTTGDHDIRTWICTGFVEHVIEPGGHYPKQLTPLMGPRLRDAFEAFARRM